MMAEDKRPPPEYFEATPGGDIAEVSERYSPEALAAEDKAKAEIKALVAASRKSGPAVKFLASPNGYRMVNKQLRGGTVLKRDRQKVADTVALLDAAFKDPAFKAARDLALWRPVTPQFAKDLDKAEDGVFHDHGYVVAMTEERPLKLAVQIAVKAGTPVIPLGPHLVGSVLLNRDQTYKVVNVVDRPDGRRR